MSTLSPEPEPAERRAVDDPATLAIAARIVRVALARQAPVARLTPVEGSRHAGGARWSPGLAFRTRTAALAALLAQATR